MKAASQMLVVIKASAFLHLQPLLYMHEASIVANLLMTEVTRGYGNIYQ